LRTLHRLFGPERCMAAVTLPGDRRDDLITASAQVIADGVRRAVLYDDEDPRGRVPGEVSALVEREMRHRRPNLTAVRADGYRDAVEKALQMARSGDVVLVLYEHLHPVLSLLTEIGFTLAPAGLLAPHTGSVAPEKSGETVAASIKE
jgi:cyanophycin synthetase